MEHRKQFPRKTSLRVWVNVQEEAMLRHGELWGTVRFVWAELNAHRMDGLVVVMFSKCFLGSVLGKIHPSYCNQRSFNVKSCGEIVLSPFLLVEVETNPATERKFLKSQSSGYNSLS